MWLPRTPARPSGQGAAHKCALLAWYSKQLSRHSHRLPAGKCIPSSNLLRRCQGLAQEGENPPASKSVDSTTLQGTHDSVCLCTVPLWIFTHCMNHTLNPRARERDSIQPSQSHTPRRVPIAQRKQQNNWENMSSWCLRDFFPLV